MQTEIDLSEDHIDITEVIDRVEELENEMPDNDNEMRNWANSSEYDELTNLLKQLEGEGGDVQWRGNWYPNQLIDYVCFVPYVQELLEDCGDIPSSLPHYVHIDWEATARDVMVDYSIISVQGRDYLYR